MTHIHTFIRINDVSKPRHLAAGSSSTNAAPVSWNGMIAGASAGCIECGEVRAVYDDGEVRILHKGHANE